MTTTSKAVLAAVAAFSCWGLFPIYWKLFPELPGDRLFMHRLSWSLLTLAIIIPLAGKLEGLKAIYREPRKRWWLVLSAALISVNWLLYMIAVTSGMILEASMGYFLNPLFNLVIGGVFLRERLRKTQWPAVAFAVLGVVWIGAKSGLEAFPWMALALSLTWGTYGVIRKQTAVGSLEGLSFETAVVYLPFLVWFLGLGGSFAADVQALGWKFPLLMLSGAVTCLPLVLFAYAAKRMPLQQLGFIQYLSPSLKFVCGWLIFNEPLSAARWQGFVLIWVGLAWYTLEALRSRERSRAS